MSPKRSKKREEREFAVSGA